MASVSWLEELMERMIRAFEGQAADPGGIAVATLA